MALLTHTQHSTIHYQPEAFLHGGRLPEGTTFLIPCLPGNEPHQSPTKRSEPPQLLSIPFYPSPSPTARK